MTRRRVLEPAILLCFPHPVRMLKRHTIHGVSSGAHILFFLQWSLYPTTQPTQMHEY